VKESDSKKHPAPGARLAALHAAIGRGLAAAEAGRVKSVEEVFDRLEAKYRALIEDDGKSRP
jgi:hypothetical protein